MIEIDYISAFFIGIAGAGHCIAMCGGITSVLLANVDKKQHSKFQFIASYNIGRILSYTIAGAIAGFTGSLAVKTIGLQLTWLRAISAIFVILLGLYIGQWLLVLHKIESIGKVLWQYIQPLSKRFIPVKNTSQALFLGMLWGWLPCGLIYSTLTWSMASGSLYKGAIIMFLFGLGTLPALLTLSSGFQYITHTLKNKYFRKITSFLLVLYGFYSLFIALNQMI